MKALTKRLAALYGTTSEKSVLLSRLTGVLGIDMLVKASGFLLIPFYLVLMSQSEFGLYNYILSIIQTFSLILNLGLYIPLSRYYHSDTSRVARGRLLYTIFTTLGIAVLVILVPVYMFGLDYAIIEFLFRSQFGYDQYRLLILIGLIISTLSFTFNSYLFTSEKIRMIKSYNISRILFINIGSIAALYLIDFDAVSVRLLFTYAGELILLGVFSISLLRKIIPEFKVTVMKASLTMGLPVMISSVFGIVINFGDKFFLEKYGMLYLADYYLAISFASIIPLIFASFQNVWLPLFMKEKDVEKNYHKTRKIIYRQTAIFFILALLIWTAFQILLHTGIVPWKYRSVSGLLPVVLLAQIVACIVPLLSNFFVYFEKTRIVSIAGFFVSIAYLLLAFWLIPLYNVYGAGITVLLSNVLYLIIYYFTLLKVKKKNAGKTVQSREVVMYE